jgi:signal transduction histidine kinase
MRRDLAIAGVSFAGGLVMLAVGVTHPFDTSTGIPIVAFVVPLAVASGALVLRRIATRTGLAIGTVAVVGDLVLGGSLPTFLVYSQVIYDACVYGPARLWRRIIATGIVLTAVGAVAGIALFSSWRGLALGIVPALGVVLPAVTGISVRQYRDQATTERIRADQTARLVELDRQQAVAAERTRMARELHDVIANHLSAVAIHATAALSIRDRSGVAVDGAVDQALRVIRENSVQGLAEMRQMIELLREEANPDALTRARLSEVDRLVAQARGAGLTVRLETVGEPRALPVSVDLAAYRIVQESLTNALKHGTGQAGIEVGYAAGMVLLTVENPVNSAPAAPGAGAGLIGMRERAALLGGRLDAGVHGKLWRVHAELPA